MFGFNLFDFLNMVDISELNESQDMILGWTTPTSKGEHLVKQFKLKGG